MLFLIQNIPKVTDNKILEIKHSLETDNKILDSNISEFGSDDSLTYKTYYKQSVRKLISFLKISPYCVN